jgi:ADP-dependent NAD(P)H-hydrate dehydratase
MARLKASIQRVSRCPALPRRPAEGHKGLFGRVLVVGGNGDMIGAPVFAGTAALRMGSGLVQIAVPERNIGLCLSITPELIGLGLGDSPVEPSLIEAAEKADAIVIGPGLGQGDGARKRLARLWRLEKPVVVDADGLNLIAAMGKWPGDFAAKAVLTPHPGEMGRLIPLIGKRDVPTDEAGRIKLAVAAAVAFGQVIVLKGARTVVTDGKRVFVNDTGDSTLSKAGTGDVLSGMIGCLLGQKMDRFDAAALGVHLHGLAGEFAGKIHGQRCALAREVIDAIPEAVRSIERGGRRKLPR